MNEKKIKKLLFICLFLTIPVLNDDNADSVSGSNANDGDSIVTKNKFYVDRLTVGEIVDGAEENNFILTYDKTEGEITLEKDGQAYSVDDPGSPVNVHHVMVSSGNNDYASWRICGMGKYWVVYKYRL